MDPVAHPIAILGAGAWGTALALHLSRQGQAVRLWAHDPKQTAVLSKERINHRYLPSHPFPDALQPIIELRDALDQVNDILIAVPSIGFRDLLLTLKPLLHPLSRIAWATKGLDEKTGQLLHETVRDCLGKEYPLAVVTGPSFATEVANKQPTAIVVASNDLSFARDLAARFNTSFFRVYTSTDIIGAEIGGAIKNVLAIATGIADGMGLGANARAALLTRSLVEMMRLGTALDAQTETLIGLAGLGDLILTATDNQSRNRRFGLSIGQGNNHLLSEKEMGGVVEGKRNAELVMQLAVRHNVSMPITQAVRDILRGAITPADAMQALLARPTY